MNSVHEQCPNNDPKQCTVKKLGRVHSAHTQKPGRVHAARVVPRSWALLRAQPIGREHVTRSVCAGHGHSAQVVGLCRDLLPLPSPRPGRDIISRSRPPRQLSQVTTSIPCRDLPSAQLKPSRSRPKKWGRDTNSNKPGRDLKSMSRQASAPPTEPPLSRHQTTTRQP